LPQSQLRLYWIWNLLFAESCDIQLFLTSQFQGEPQTLFISLSFLLLSSLSGPELHLTTMASTNSTLPPNRWAVYDFTTTPEERIGPGAPYTYPALQANLFFRVFLGIVSLFVTWVPARLLWRNGEFGGTVLCVMLLILNVITVVNALIWRDNNVETWWAGHGWCDIQTYTFFALHTVFNICMFEIMRSLASKVALSRTVKPTRSERRRGHIVSALIVFTVPVIQVILTYFSTVSRYNISTLVGCSAVYYPNWIYLVFYIIPTPVFAVLAAYMAGE
jgi:pheromone a factor receptor